MKQNCREIVQVRLGNPVKIQINTLISKLNIPKSIESVLESTFKYLTCKLLLFNVCPFCFLDFC